MALDLKYSLFITYSLKWFNSVEIEELSQKILKEVYLYHVVTKNAKAVNHYCIEW